MSLSTTETMKELSDLFKLLEEVPKFDSQDLRGFEDDWNDWSDRLSTEICHIRDSWLGGNPAEPWKIIAHPDKPWGCAIYNTEDKVYWLSSSGKKPQFYSDRNRAVKQAEELNSVYVTQQIQLTQKES